MKKITLLTALLLNGLLLAGQTYTFSPSSGNDWTTAANWSPSPPPNPLPSGSSIVITGGLCIMNLNYTVNSGATITVNAGSTLRVPNGRTFNNAGTFNNSGTFQSRHIFNNSGSFNNNGTVAHGNTGTDEFNNTGMITNNGTININQGTLTNNGTVTNNGTINNNSSGTFINNETVINNSGATINNNGTMDNDGSSTFTNSGTFNQNGKGTLPIELLSFTGKRVGGAVALHWRTGSERNNAYVEVQRSTDGKRFTALGALPSKTGGESAVPQDYYFTDTQPLPGINYYRLRQVDFDGVESFHSVIAVLFQPEDKAASITLFPTVVRDQLFFALPAEAEEDGEWFIADLNGRVLQRQPFAPGFQQGQAPVSNLPAGHYVLTVRAGHAVQVARFVK